MEPQYLTLADLLASGDPAATNEVASRAARLADILKQGQAAPVEPPTTSQTLKGFLEGRPDLNIVGNIGEGARMLARPFLAARDSLADAGRLAQQAGLANSLAAVPVAGYEAVKHILTSARDSAERLGTQGYTPGIDRDPNAAEDAFNVVSLAAGAGAPVRGAAAANTRRAMLPELANAADRPTAGTTPLSERGYRLEKGQEELYAPQTASDVVDRYLRDLPPVDRLQPGAFGRYLDGLNAFDKAEPPTRALTEDGVNPVKLSANDRRASSGLAATAAMGREEKTGIKAGSSPGAQLEKVTPATEHGFDTNTVFYRGDDAAISEFDLSKAGSKRPPTYAQGIHLTQYLPDAKGYGKNVGEFYTRVKKPFVFNPDDLSSVREVFPQARFNPGGDGIVQEQIPAFTQALRDRGYDAVDVYHYAGAKRTIGERIILDPANIQRRGDYLNDASSAGSSLNKSSSAAPGEIVTPASGTAVAAKWAAHLQKLAEIDAEIARQRKRSPDGFFAQFNQPIYRIVELEKQKADLEKAATAAGIRPPRRPLDNAMWDPQRAAKAEGAAPRRATGLSLSTRRDLSSEYNSELPGEPFHYFIHKNGKVIGDVRGVLDGKKLIVEEIETDGGPNAIGLAGTRRLLGDLQEDFPDANVAQSVPGKRISGARSDGHHDGATQTVILKGRGDRSSGEASASDALKPK